MKHIIMSVFITVTVGCTSLPDSKTVTTEHGSFTYHISGTGEPTVVLEAGLGDDMTEWEAALSQIEDITQIFTYNRAGYLGSDSKNEQRDAKTIVDELRDLLNKTNIKPPYILVGHSLGGLYMQLYAKTYPNDVAGVILVDSTHPGTEERCKKTDGSFCEPPDEIPWWAKLVLPNAVAGEYKAMPISMEQVRKNIKFPEIPLVVLSRGKNPWGNDDKEDWQKERWLKAQNNQKNLATISPISKQVVCLSCGHYVHQDKPKLLTEAIQWVLEKM